MGQDSVLSGVLHTVTLYILRFIPEIFNLPHYGSRPTTSSYIFPMLLASAFLGQTLNYFMKSARALS